MKNLSKILVLIVAMLTLSLSASAQRQNRRGGEQRSINREQLAEKQAQYIAQKLSLSTETAEKFVATYINCQKEVWALNSRPNKGRRTSLTDAQADSLIQARFNHSQKLLDIRKKYYAEYSKFLTPKQIESVYEQEGRMMRSLKERRKCGKSAMRKSRERKQ